MSQSHFGSAPASRAAVEALNKGKVDAEFLKAREHTGKSACPICQTDWVNGDSWVEMPCGHCFHAECLNPWLRDHSSCPNCRQELPHDAEWVRQHAQQQQHRRSAANTPPGTRHTCGRIHAYRGDRVRRGPAWPGGNADGGSGRLGTIVREEEASERVFVQWDAAPSGRVEMYQWPTDPSQHGVVHVPFTTVDEDVAVVQRSTGLSSAAAHILLSRNGYASGGAAAAALAPHSSGGSAEHNIRGRPARCFRRVRVLPDEAAVKQFYDATPNTCNCGRPNCTGGVSWGDAARQHLGMEGYIVRVDSGDNTVMVHHQGRHSCKRWYPHNAVEEVYDPDTEVALRFNVGHRVECRIDGQWARGTIDHLWWRGECDEWRGRSSAPYSIALDDGRTIYAPRDDDSCIRMEQIDSARAEADKAAAQTGLQQLIAMGFDRDAAAAALLAARNNVARATDRLLSCDN